MPDHRFEDARLRITRANEFTKELSRAATSYLTSGANRLRIVDDARYRYIRLEAEHSVLKKLGVLAGDAAHSLRAALDLAIWALMPAPSPNPERIQFPFTKNHENLDAEITRRQISLAGTQIVSAVKNLEPYPRGRLSLYELHQFDVENKHRLIAPIVLPVIFRDLSLVQIDAGAPPVNLQDVGFVGWDSLVRWDLHGRSAHRMLSEFLLQKNSKDAINFDLAFIEGPFAGKKLLACLDEMTSSVEQAIGVLEEAATKAAF